MRIYLDQAGSEALGLPYLTNDTTGVKVAHSTALLKHATDANTTDWLTLNRGDITLTPLSDQPGWWQATKAVPIEGYTDEEIMLAEKIDRFDLGRIMAATAASGHNVAVYHNAIAFYDGHPPTKRIARPAQWATASDPTDVVLNVYIPPAQ